jgi:tetratricopeptide (TPR) repeat protein
MDRYLGLLHSGGALATGAFETSFGGALMEEAIRAYDAFLRRQGEMLTVTTTFTVPPTTVSDVRDLTLAEKHVLWGRLRPYGPEGFVRALRDAERAIASDEFGVDGYLLRAELHVRSDPSTESGKALRASLSLPEGGFASAAADLRLALARQPKDTRVMGALLGLLLDTKGSPKDIEALAEALAPQAKTAFEFNALAVRELRRGKPEQALALSQKALDQDAVCRTCLETRAITAFHLGQYELAVRSQRFALNVAEDDATPAMSDRLAKFERRLLEATAAGAHPAPALSR